MKTKVTLISVLIFGVFGYLIPLYFGEVWLGLGILLISATIFIAILLGDSRQYFESKWAYRIITGLTLLLIVFHGLKFRSELCD